MDDDQPNGRLDRFLSEHKLSLVFSLVGLVLIIGGVISSGIIPKIFLKSTTSASQNQVLPDQTESFGIMVDVAGAVNNPGVYQLTADSRVEEAILAAGGVTKDADADHLAKSVNLALKIQDGMKIYIPFKGETVSSSVVSNVGGVAGVSNQPGIVSINSASSSELEDLPGIGPVTAEKIISNRPYASSEELLLKKSVNKATYEKIKDKISI